MREFQRIGDLPKTSVDEFGARVPAEIVELWKGYGLGSIADGFIKIIDPAEYLPLCATSLANPLGAVPLFATGLGDLLVWHDGFLRAVKFRYHRTDVVARSMKYFLDDLGDEEFLDDNLSRAPYSEAVEQHGKLAFDECFGYVPLLALGGSESAARLQKVKLIEHVELITQLSGPVP